MSGDKLDPTKTYVLDETATTKSLTLEQLAKLATGDGEAPEWDFEAALKPRQRPSAE